MDSKVNHQFRRLPKSERRVRFADSMGMELVSIFLFDLITNYYFASIHNHKPISLPKPEPSPPPKTEPTPPPEPKALQSSGQENQSVSLVCNFTQPISFISFKERVRLNKVHLETCTVNSRAGNTSISCVIRVLNISYNKSVMVRYTTDEWHTYTDSLASYQPGSCDGWSDRFTSTFSVTNQIKELKSGQRIIFAVKCAFESDRIHWDNNGGLNYTINKIH